MEFAVAIGVLGLHSPVLNSKSKFVDYEIFVSESGILIQPKLKLVLEILALDWHWFLEVTKKFVGEWVAPDSILENKISLQNHYSNSIIALSLPTAKSTMYWFLLANKTYMINSECWTYHQFRRNILWWHTLTGYSAMYRL